MARSSSIGGIFAELTLRDQKFASGMKGAGAKLKAFGNAAARYGAMAGAALGGGLAVGVQKTLALGGHLSDLSAQTGIAVDQLIRIQQAYKDNGKDADSAAKDINKMQRAIYEASQDPGGSMDFFKEMGLSAQALMGMNPEQQFFAIRDAIMSIKNPTKQAALAMDVFGRSGGQLLTVFKGSDLESVNRTLGKMPELMAEFANEMDHADDLLNRMPGKATQFFTGFTAGVVTQIIPSLETIDGYDFTMVGKNLGDSLTKGIMAAASHLAIFSNALMDSLEGENFVDALHRYAAAQVQAEREDEQAREDRKRQSEADAAYERARMEEYRTAPDYVDPATVQAAATVTKKVSSSMNLPDFDSYQARGLSLSTSPTADMEKKTLNVMEQVRDILSRIERTNPQAVF